MHDDDASDSGASDDDASDDDATDDDTSDCPAALRRGADTHRVIKGRRWRVSDPALDDDLRQRLVDSLMAARRAVKRALADDDDVALAEARRRVGDAKIALGERGPEWWNDMTEDDITERIECCRRSLRAVEDPAADADDLRSRLRL